MNRRTFAIRQFVAIGLALIGALFVIGKCTACAELTPSQKSTAAAALYEEQQRACVDQYADTAHIDACRAKVKAAWATDAGKDGAQ